jgi:hypothetical protein
MSHHDGGCLCGQVRFQVSTLPIWVTVCYCRFCQKATGSDHMVEPIFKREAFGIIEGTAQVFTLQSQGSGQDVNVHFCGNCGTKLALTFARWPDRLGIYAGTFDDPGWFTMTPHNTKHIFTAEAARGTVIPAGFPVFQRHAAENDGTPRTPEIYGVPRTVS